MSEMTDDEFVSAFLLGSINPRQFHHQDHVRLAWYLTRRDGVNPAMQTITSAIRTFATAHGQADKYHETLTRFWVRIVGHLIDARPEIDTFGAFVAAFPLLLDKELPYRHWRRETMGGAVARTEWVEPDLLALPA